MQDNQLDTTLDRLRELFHQEYNRGTQDALRRMVDSMKDGPKVAPRKAAKRGTKERATRGSAKAFIERVLKEKKGATVPQIMAAAQSMGERRVSISAVRFELYRGKKERRYSNSKGLWSLPPRTSAKSEKTAKPAS